MGRSNYRRILNSRFFLASVEPITARSASFSTARWFVPTWRVAANNQSLYKPTDRKPNHGHGDGWFVHVSYGWSFEHDMKWHIFTHLLHSCAGFSSVAVAQRIHRHLGGAWPHWTLHWAPRSQAEDSQDWLIKLEPKRSQMQNQYNITIYNKY